MDLMFYDKQIINVSKSTKTVVLSNFSGGLNSFYDDSVLPLKYAKMTYNFDNESGALKCGKGLTELLVNSNGFLTETILPQTVFPKRCYFYKRYDFENLKEDDRLLVYCDDKKIYELKLNNIDNEFIEIEGLVFENPPEALNYKYNSEDVIIFSTENEGIKIYSARGYPIEISNTPKITSMCMHYERLFATTGGEKTSLWFSDDFDPLNWYISLDEAGFIDMPDERGALLKVISFLDYVYVFRSYGISRITAYADQTEFSASKLFVSSGKIFGDTVTVCGDRVIFLAEDGLYQFDGIYTKRILEGYDRLILSDNILTAKGEFLNGKFYLAFNLEIEGENKRVLLTYNISEKTSYISILPIDDVTKIAANTFSKLVFIANGKLCQLCEMPRLIDTPLNMVWQSPLTDFGYGGETKLLKLIRLKLYGTITLTANSENDKRTIKLKGKGGYVLAKINMRGSVFGFRIESQFSGVEIGRPVIVFDTF
jgi:hypothetical protein